MPAAFMLEPSWNGNPSSVPTNFLMNACAGTKVQRLSAYHLK